MCVICKMHLNMQKQQLGPLKHRPAFSIHSIMLTTLQLDRCQCCIQVITDLSVNDLTIDITKMYVYGDNQFHSLTLTFLKIAFWLIELVNVITQRQQVTTLGATEGHSPLEGFLLDQGALYVLAFLSALLLPHDVCGLGSYRCLNVVRVYVIKPKVLSTVAQSKMKLEATFLPRLNISRSRRRILTL